MQHVAQMILLLRHFASWDLSLSLSLSLSLLFVYFNEVYNEDLWPCAMWEQVVVGCWATSHWVKDAEPVISIGTKR